MVKRLVELGARNCPPEKLSLGRMGAVAATFSTAVGFVTVVNCVSAMALLLLLASFSQRQGQFRQGSHPPDLNPTSLFASEELELWRAPPPPAPRARHLVRRRRSLPHLPQRRLRTPSYPHRTPSLHRLTPSFPRLLLDILSCAAMRHDGNAIHRAARVYPVSPPERVRRRRRRRRRRRAVDKQHL